MRVFTLVTSPKVISKPCLVNGSFYTRKNCLSDLQAASINK